jgi:hypothetical protein
MKVHNFISGHVENCFEKGQREGETTDFNSENYQDLDKIKL